MSPKSLKILVSATLILLLVLVITPVLVGLGVRDLTISNSLDLLAPETREQLQINTTHFENGWFRSNAVIEMQYLALGAQPLSLELELQMQHGPLLFTDRGPTLGLAYARIYPRFNAADMRAAIAELPFPLPTTEIDLLSGFDGSLRLGIDIEPVQHADSEGQLSFEGLQALFLVHPDRSADFSLNMGKLAAREAGTSFEFTIDGIAISYETLRMDDLLAPSTTTLTLPAFSSQSPYPISVRDVSSITRLQASQTGADRSDIYQHMQIGNIESDLPLTSMSWTSEINETRNDLFRRYYLLLTQIQGQISSNTGTITPQINQSGQEFALLFMQNRIVLNNSVVAQAYGGDHSADLRITWNGLPDLTEIMRLNLYDALAALSLTLDLSLDLEAVTRSPLAEFVDPYVQEGYLRLDNGRILMQASLIDSKLTVNGKTILLDQYL